MTTRSMLCRTASWLFFKTEPRFGRCRASKCPFHVSSINRTCVAHRVVYITNGFKLCSLSPTSLQSVRRWCWASYTWPNKCGRLVRLSIAPWTRGNKVILWHYRSAIHNTLHTTPQKRVERRQISWPRNWSPSTISSIWICNVEVIPHISIKFRRWLRNAYLLYWVTKTNRNKLCHPFVLNHRRSTAPKIVHFRKGFPSWTMIILPSCTTY